MIFFNHLSNMLNIHFKLIFVFTWLSFYLLFLFIIENSQLCKHFTCYFRSWAFSYKTWSTLFRWVIDLILFLIIFLQHHIKVFKMNCLRVVWIKITTLIKKFFICFKRNVKVVFKDCLKLHIINTIIWGTILSRYILKNCFDLFHVFFELK